MFYVGVFVLLAQVINQVEHVAKVVWANIFLPHREDDLGIRHLKSENFVTVMKFLDFDS